MSETPIYTNDYIPIPKLFKETLTGDLFEHCLMCEKELLHDGTVYIIEKAYHKNEVIFEYAMCAECREEFRDSLSRETITKVDEFFEKIDMKSRQNYLVAEDDLDVNLWLNNCLVSGEPIASCDEYQIFACCDGPDLIFLDYPYMISGDAIEEVQKLISKKSQGDIDDFIRDHLNKLPDFDKILSGPYRVLV